MSKINKDKAKTYVAIVLDKSGSMGGTQAQTIAGYNEQIQQLREDAKDTEIYVSLVTFNGEVFEHFWNVPAAELKEAAVEEYRPGGNTAFRDAVGYAIKKLQETTDTKDENNGYLIIAISDGYENSSSHFSAEQLRRLIDSCEETGRWTITYMGCDATYLKEVARQTGIKLDNMALWNNTSSSKTTRGLHQNRSKLAAYMTFRKGGEYKASNFHSEMEGCFADYSYSADEIGDVNITNSKPTVFQVTPNIPPKTEVSITTFGGFGSPKNVTWTTNYRPNDINPTT